MKLQLLYHINTTSFFKIVDDILYSHRFINFQTCRKITLGHVYELENNGQQFICHSDIPYGNYKKFYCDCLKIGKVDTRRKKLLKITITYVI